MEAVWREQLFAYFWVSSGEVSTSFHNTFELHQETRPEKQWQGAT
jgi:hypothetical protein